MYVYTIESDKIWKLVLGGGDCGGGGGERVEVGFG